MRTIKLTHRFNNPIIILFDAIIYPEDRAAIFNNKPFSKKKLDYSVQYNSCKQISKGSKIIDMDYYKWTIQKLKKFGRKYENFLFSEGKGCSINALQLKNFIDLDVKENYNLMAQVATQQFINLFCSIMQRWNPSLSSDREITFYKVGNKFMIDEGRHRLSILYYKYKNMGFSAFETDLRNIKKDYYIRKMRNYISKIFHGIFGQRQIINKLKSNQKIFRNA